jgi:vacuolar-type H+-ATPase subunit E/Vma4
VTAAFESSDLLASESALEVELRPLRDALRHDAEQRAGALLADADRDAAAVLADARRRAEELLGAAREQGAADARRRGARVVADARRRTRSQVLQARRELYERVRSLARERLEQLGDTPGARNLNARLTAEARERLGPDAVVQVSADAVGIIVVAGRRRLDLSAGALVERELSTLGARIEEMWS